MTDFDPYSEKIADVCALIHQHGQCEAWELFKNAENGLEVLCAIVDAVRAEAKAAVPVPSPEELDVLGYQGDAWNKLLQKIEDYMNVVDIAGSQFGAEPKAAEQAIYTYVWSLMQRGVVQMTGEQVQWITNDNGELGVKIGEQFFFLYKGCSLVYEEGKHDDGRPMMWRNVGKREFGECAYPINYDDPTKIGTVSINDGRDWKELPPAIPRHPTI
jgi:hypothetical protein